MLEIFSGSTVFLKLLQMITFSFMKCAICFHILLSNYQHFEGHLKCFLSFFLSFFLNSKVTVKFRYGVKLRNLKYEHTE